MLQVPELPANAREGGRLVPKLGVRLSSSLKQKSELPQGWGVEGWGGEGNESESGRPLNQAFDAQCLKRTLAQKLVFTHFSTHGCCQHLTLKILTKIKMACFSKITTYISFSKILLPQSKVENVSYVENIVTILF